MDRYFTACRFIVKRLSSKTEKLKEEWESDLSARESRVEKLKQDISKYETAFNFVGLFQGFDDLATEKKKERDNLLFWLKVLGTVIAFPIAVELFSLCKYKTARFN